MKFNIIENSGVVPKRIKEIYACNGWGNEEDYPDKTIEDMFSSLTYYCLCLDDKKNIVGFLKAFSDTYSTQLTEIVVHPSVQRKGCGRLMMRYFLENYKHTPIFITGVNNTFVFFEKFGFRNKDSLYACSKRPVK